MKNRIYVPPYANASGQDRAHPSMDPQVYFFFKFNLILIKLSFDEIFLI